MLQWPVLELSAVCLGKVNKFTHYFFFMEQLLFRRKTLVCVTYVSLCLIFFQKKLLIFKKYFRLYGVRSNSDTGRRKVVNNKLEGLPIKLSWSN